MISYGTFSARIQLANPSRFISNLHRMEEQDNRSFVLVALRNEFESLMLLDFEHVNF